MNDRLAVAALTLWLGCGVAGVATAAPPTDARPLSEIVRAIEARADFRHFDEIEWDDDGYWEVEYVDRHGRKVELKIDPRSGQPRR